MCTQLETMEKEDQIRWNRAFNGLICELSRINAVIFDLVESNLLPPPLPARSILSGVWLYGWLKLPTKDEAYFSFARKFMPGEPARVAAEENQLLKTDMHFVLFNSIGLLVDRYVSESFDARSWTEMHAMDSVFLEHVEDVERKLRFMNEPNFELILELILEKYLYAQILNDLPSNEDGDVDFFWRSTLHRRTLKNEAFRFTKREEMMLLRMLVYHDQSVLERLISGDIPDVLDDYGSFSALPLPLPLPRPSRRYVFVVAVMWCVAMASLCSGILYFLYSVKRVERQNGQKNHKKKKKKRK